jgi:RNA polymerase sigma factor (sigma-70 family)
MEEPLQAWFKREILVHEEALTRFLARVWPRQAELADLRQEVYARIFDTARKARPTAPKAFLFATARHLMADRIRRERIVSIQALGENDFLNVLVDDISPERRVGSHQELERLARAFDQLPTQARKVVWLRRVKELSQKEVAARLGLDEKTVEKHLASGARLLVHYMRANMLSPNATYTGIQKRLGDDEGNHEHGTHPRD